MVIVETMCAETTKAKSHARMGDGCFGRIVMIKFVCFLAYGFFKDIFEDVN
jgi:hypothetical protein